MITKKQIYFIAEVYDEVYSSLDQVLVGQRDAKKVLTASLLCDSNSRILLTGNTGAGKTTVSKFLASGFKSQRISVTSDMIARDIQDQLRYYPDLECLVIDEFNRASGKVQTAFIELFAERQMSMNGINYPFGNFYVLATQNSADISGIFNVSQAVYDRFDVNIYFDNLLKSDKKMVIFQDFQPLTQSTIDIKKLQQASKIVDSFQLPKETTDLLFQAFDYIDTMKIGSKSLFAGDNIRAHKFALKLVKLMALASDRNYVLPTDLFPFVKCVYMHRIDQRIAKIGSKAVEDKFHEVENKVKTMKFPTKVIR